jgi:hypothetical protein
MEKIQIAGPMPPFIKPLRDAIRVGSKTVTRRVFKSQPPDTHKLIEIGADTLTGKYGAEFHDGAHAAKFYPCRYGQPGQYRYMREPIYKGTNGLAYFADDDRHVRNCDGRPVRWRWKVNTLAQIYLPAEYARTFVRVTDIQAQQVQGMTHHDCLQEGIDTMVLLPDEADPHAPESIASAHRQIVDAFSVLWDSINAKRGYSWASNPWVWVVGFQIQES